MRLVTIGNLTLDEVVTDSHRHSTTPGGSALFVSATAASLGVDTSIVSGIGLDYPSGVVRWMSRRGIGLRSLIHVDAPNTRFRLQYSRGGRRRIELLESGATLYPRGVSGNPEVIHLGPVFQEIGLGVAQYARSKCKLLSLDVQGLIRTKDSKKRVRLGPRNLDGFLEICDVVKASLDEGKLQTSERDPFRIAEWFLERGPSYCVITMGENGSIIAARNRIHRVPAFPEEDRVDTTGAGDVLMAGFLVAFYRTKDPLWATSVGCALASLVVRRYGLSKFRFSRDSVMRRAFWIYGHADNKRVV